MKGLGEIAEKLRRATVRILSGDRQGMGSGVVWNSNGVILTNAHVARGANATVELWDGRQVEATLEGSDPRRDLAMLKTSVTDLEPAQPGDSDALRPGDLVIAVGNPLGFQGAVSTGVVHSVGKLRGMGGQSWIRAGVRLAPGNSGGPLANAEGRVVGINTAIMNGLGVAAPIKSVLDFLRKGARPALGITIRALKAGLMILDIEPTGAASAASLHKGDVLLSSWDDLNDALDSGSEVVRLRFLRGNNHVREVAVRIGARTD